MKNIVIIGMPSSGKTTLGKLLSEKLNRPFIDMDIALEERDGITISEMCRLYGKEYFRDRESQIAQEVSRRSGVIIATGGGTVLRSENMQALSQSGVVVFLHRSPDDIIKSGVDTQSRPFLREPQEIYTLYKDRLPLYKKYSHFTAENINLTDCLTKLLEIAETIKSKKHFYVIGSPVSHSLSPAIHTTVLDAVCDDASYKTQQVEPHELKAWIERVKKENISGFNITMPHKQGVMELLDQLDETAIRYSAVNTVVNKKGKLIGYNTDAQGFFSSLTRLGFCPLGARFVFLGAGGAAGALAKEAAQQGAKSICILARNTEKARSALPLDLGEMELIYDSFEYSKISDYCKDADILINCTPLGMEGTGQDFLDFSFLDALPRQALVADLIYKPSKTHLLAEAEKRGIRIQNGLGMLIYQALIADYHYLGASFDLETMYNKISQRLTAKL